MKEKESKSKSKKASPERQEAVVVQPAGDSADIEEAVKERAG